MGFLLVLCLCWCRCPCSCVQRMAPPSKDNDAVASEVHATHATFSRDGKTVLASFGGEHVYTFPRAGGTPTTFCDTLATNSPASAKGAATAAAPAAPRSSMHPSVVARALALKNEGNVHCGRKLWTLAIQCYSEGLYLLPNSIPLRANRALVSSQNITHNGFFATYEKSLLWDFG